MGKIALPTDISPDEIIPPHLQEEELVVLKDSTSYLNIDGELHVEKVNWYYYPGTKSMPHNTFSFIRSIVAEKPLSIEAAAIYPNGSTWKLNQLNIDTYSEKNDNERTIVGGSNSVSLFEVPSFQPGTTVRTKVIRRYKHKEFANPVFFRASAPTLQKVVKVDTSIITPVVINSESLSIKTSLEGSTYTYQVDSLDAIHSSSMPNHPEEWYAAVHVGYPQGESGWSALGDFYLNMIKDSVAHTKPRKKLKQDEALKTIDSAFTNVTSNIRYMLYLDSISAIVPCRPETVKSNGYGDCKGMSNLLSTMLREKNIDAGMALVKIKGIQANSAAPTMTTFDHIIVWCVAGKDTLFLDPTNSNSSWHNSTWELVDQNLLILTENGSYYRTYKPNKWLKNNIITESEIVRSEGNRFIQKGTITMAGYYATKLYSLKKQTNYERDELYKSWFISSFAFLPENSSIDHLSYDSVVISYNTPVTGNYVDMDNGGIRIRYPSTFGGISGYTTFNHEGSYTLFPLFQKDTWTLPHGFTELESVNVDTEAISAAVSRNGRTVSRSLNIKYNHAIEQKKMRPYFDTKRKLNKMIIWN